MQTLYQSCGFLPLLHNTMHTLNVTSTFGNFRFTAEAEATDEQLIELGKAGLLQLLQRSPATAAEKELAGYGDKRPKEFKRNSIDFSEANAAILAKHLGKVVVEADSTVDADGKEVAGAKSDLMVLVEVAEHVPNSGAEPKYKAEKDFVKLYLGSNGGKLASGEPRTATSFAGNRGIEIPEGFDAAAWEDSTEFLTAVREWKKAEDQKKAAGE